MICSCKQNHYVWKTLDFGTFKLNAPKEWNKFKEEGVDAYVGGLTNGKDSLRFYYGWFISGPKDELAKTHLYAQDTINDFSSVVVIPKKKGSGIIELFIPYVTDKDNFYLGGKNIKDTAMVFKIFKSVKFEGSDTTKNGILSFSKFKEYPFGSGRTLYFGFCSYCHDLDRSSNTPALTDTLENKNADWLYSFLKSKTVIISNDTVINNEHQKIQLFDSLTKHDVQQLLGYIKKER